MTDTFVKDLFDTINSLADEYIRVWVDVCTLESPTENKAGVDAVGSYFADLAEARGFTVERYPQRNVGDLVTIVMNPDAPGKPIALSGHIDTVHPVGSFGRPAVRFNEDKIFGPGVTDCKGGVVAAFLAMDALRLVGYRERPVMLLLQTDEEKGSSPSGKATIRHICERAANAEAFLNCERFTRGEACVRRKGILRYEIEVHGFSTHSSSCYDGVNPITEAAYKIIELEKMKDKEGLTCNCGVIRAGETPNTVPSTCRFSVDLRFADREQMQKGAEAVEEIVAKSYLNGTTSGILWKNCRVAMELTERNKDLLARMNTVFEKCGLPTLEPSFRNGGSDAADITEYGLACVDSLGVRGGRIHTTEEFAFISSLPEAAKRLAAVVSGI